MQATNMKLQQYGGTDSGLLDTILTKIPELRIGLIGDLCIDMYWRADMTRSEMSRETPHYPLPVIEEWCSPGAGGNVAANIASLSPKKLYILGIIGEDWRGDVLMKELSRFKNVDTRGIFSSSSRLTDAYCKPIRKGISDLEYEDPRIDFSNYKVLSKEDETCLINLLDETVSKVDIICVSDQFKYGCITDGIRTRINELGRKGHLIVVDSRYSIGLFSDVILKPNEVEGWRAVYGEDCEISAVFKDQVGAAYELAYKSGAKVCMTLGKNGCVYVDGDIATHIPSYDVKPPIDICGAGDTFLSAFSCALATGVKPHEAASFANIAADVTIKKTGTTGTATAGEIKNRHNEIFKSTGVS